MELGLTIPLQKHLRLAKPPYGIETDLRLCWDLHLLKPGGKPSLFAVHASSRFSFLLYAVSPAEWKNLPELFASGLRQCLSEEDFSAEIQKRYFELAGPLCLTKTHGRRPVAFLNRAVDDLYATPVQLDSRHLYQPMVTRFLNDPVCHAAGHQGYGTARGFFHGDMADLLRT